MGIIVVIAAVLAGVYVYLSKGKTEEVSRETQVWWIASDPHVGYFQAAYALTDLQVGIDDVNEYVEKIEGVNVDHAILLGDLVHESTIYTGMFLRAMDNLKVDNWYYILGNHDYNQNAGNKSANKWTDNLLPEVDTTLDVMGMKWILISDHAGDTNNLNPPEYDGGTMPENVQEWFISQVLNSDKPVFVFSHQPPAQWKVWTDNLQNQVYGSELRAWFYGHIHAWGGSWYENQVLEFSDCSLDWVHNHKSVFMFLDRVGNNVNVTLKFRDDENHLWIKVPFQGENIENISFSVKVS
jgi:predicted phosphodiesterase